MAWFTQARQANTMKMSRYWAHVFAVTLMGMAPWMSAFGQNYQVELVIFENLDRTGLQDEYWPAPMLDRANWGAAITPASEQTGRGAFSLLPSSQHKLTRYADSIARGKAYRPVMHLAWVQPGLGESQARAVRISDGRPINLPTNASIFVAGDTLATDAPATYRLDGTVTVYVNRFIHVQTQLALTEPAPTSGTPENPLSDTPRWREYALVETRRLRTGEIHYLDNPRFGILVRVDPLR
ncbi:MAG: CsiV family protein [Pseudomonadota bacterium]|nr:CsiV family protein [Pseudomonadota bacterium]